jgi:hypothetical protein
MSLEAGVSGGSAAEAPVIGGEKEQEDGGGSEKGAPRTPAGWMSLLRFFGLRAGLRGGRIEQD